MCMCVYIYNCILISHKKNIIFPFTTWNNLEGSMSCEISQPEKDICCMLSFIGGIYKVEEINEYNKANRLKHIETVSVVITSGKREGCRVKLAVGIKKYTRFISGLSILFH